MSATFGQGFAGRARARFAQTVQLSPRVQTGHREQSIQKVFSVSSKEFLKSDSLNPITQV